jgi:hypothetical protein
MLTDPAGSSSSTLRPASSSAGEEGGDAFNDIGIVPPPHALTSAHCNLCPRCLTSSLPDSAYYSIIAAGNLIASTAASMMMNRESLSMLDGCWQEGKAIDDKSTTSTENGDPMTFNVEVPYKSGSTVNTTPTATAVLTASDILSNLISTTLHDHKISTDNTSLAVFVHAQLSGLKAVPYSVLAVLLPLAASFQTTTGVYVLSLSPNVEAALTEFCSNYVLRGTNDSGRLSMEAMEADLHRHSGTASKLFSTTASSKLPGLRPDCRDVCDVDHRSSVRKRINQWIASILVSVCALTAQVHVAATSSFQQRTHSLQRETLHSFPTSASQPADSAIDLTTNPADCSDIQDARDHCQQQQDINGCNQGEDMTLRQCQQAEANEADELCACLQLLMGHELQGWSQGLITQQGHHQLHKVENCSSKRCCHGDNNEQADALMDRAQQDHDGSRDRCFHSATDDRGPKSWLSLQPCMQPCTLLFSAGVAAVQVMG